MEFSGVKIFRLELVNGRLHLVRGQASQEVCASKPGPTVKVEVLENGRLPCLLLKQTKGGAHQLRIQVTGKMRNHGDHVHAIRAYSFTTRVLDLFTRVANAQLKFWPAHLGARNRKHQGRGIAEILDEPYRTRFLWQIMN